MASSDGIIYWSELRMIDMILGSLHDAADESLDERWANKVGPHQYEAKYEASRHNNHLFLRDRKTGEAFKVTVTPTNEWPA